MPPLYIRPESLSLLDLSLVILSSPTEISKPYPCALLISHHSGPRDPRGVFVLLLSYHHLSPSLVERATTSYLASCRVTSLWRHLPNYLPAPFDSFEALFLGRGSRCQSPQRKVGVLIVRMRLACCLKQPHKTRLLHCKNARYVLFFSMTGLFYMLRPSLFWSCCLLRASWYLQQGAPSLDGSSASLFIGILKVTLTLVLYYLCMPVREDLRFVNRYHCCRGIGILDCSVWSRRDDEARRRNVVERLFRHE